MDEFPDNTASSFRNRFVQEISVNPQAKVSLSEISFYQHLLDHRLDPARVRIFDFLYEAGTIDLPRGGSATTYGKWFEPQLDMSCFATPKELCACLNLCIYKCVPRLKKDKPTFFEYDTEMKRVWIRIKKSCNILVLIQGSLLPLIGAESIDAESAKQYLAFGRSKRLRAYTNESGDICYFDPECAKDHYEVNVSEEDFFGMPPQILKLDLIMININIVTESLLANKKVKMLRFVPLKRSNDGKYVTINFSAARNYISLRSNIFSEISIEITDIHGKAISLLGNSRLELHFINT